MPDSPLKKCLVNIFSDRARLRVGGPLTPASPAGRPKGEDRALRKQLVAVFSDRASRRDEGPLTPASPAGRPEGGTDKVNKLNRII